MIVSLIAAVLLQAAQGPANTPSPCADEGDCAGVEFFYPSADDPGACGGSSARFDVVFVGEGFTDSVEDIVRFKQKVDEAIRYLSSPPYARSAFNFYAVRLVSEQAGSDHPLDCPRPPDRNTALDSRFGDEARTSEYHDDRFLLVDICKTLAAAECLTDDYDQIVVLVNDSAYGGMYFSHDRIVTVSIGQGFENVLLHEMGHAFAGLGDEYSGSFTYDSNWRIVEPNVTAVRRFGNLVKWSADPEAVELDIPTSSDRLSGKFPDKSECEISRTLGLWQGAAVFRGDQPVYRPEYTCKMRDARKGFCKVCTRCIEAVVGKVKRTDLPVSDTALVPESLECSDGVRVRIPLPAYLECLALETSAEAAPSQQTSSNERRARVEIGPLPDVDVKQVSVTKLDTGGTLSEVGGPAVKLPEPASSNSLGPKFSVTFPIEPDALYYIEFTPVKCTEPFFSPTIRLFVNDEEIGVI